MKHQKFSNRFCPLEQSVMPMVAVYVLSVMSVSPVLFATSVLSVTLVLFVTFDPLAGRKTNFKIILD